MRPRHALRLAVAILLIAPPSAAGAYTTGQLQRWDNIAAQAWPDSPCNGRYQPRVMPADQLDQSLAVPGGVVAGSARINDHETCVYNLAGGMSDYEACVLVVHETGHLYGLEHQPDTIMDEVPLRVYPYPTYGPCVEGTEPVLTRTEAMEWVEARWGMLTLDCRRDERVSRMACWGTSAAGRRVRFVVWRGEGWRVFGGRWK